MLRITSEGGPAAGGRAAAARQFEREVMRYQNPEQTCRYLLSIHKFFLHVYLIKAKSSKGLSVCLVQYLSSIIKIL